ncbi:Glycine cleavage system H protein [Chitinispirillum alkaliphilum]|nr:Glycine cleavage system H protein [Chitinispirillum alkaliphilum]
MIPADRKYTDSHEWVLVEGDSATIGITEHAQDSLGDITFIELPDTGKKVQKGAECGVVESVKAASDIFSPLTGEVEEINDKLTTSPELINSDPYGDGWFFKVKNLSASEIESLMDSAAYEKYLETL